MVKTILYFHGFASSSDSDKAKIINSYISKISKKINVKNALEKAGLL